MVGPEKSRKELFHLILLAIHLSIVKENLFYRFHVGLELEAIFGIRV